MYGQARKVFRWQVQGEGIILRQEQQMFSTALTGASRVLVVTVMLGKERYWVKQNKALYKAWDS